jgi:outer membrane protein
MKAAAVAVLLLLPKICAPEMLWAEQVSFEQALELAVDRSEILKLQRSAVKRASLSLAEARSRLGPELTFQAAAGYLANPPEGITVQAGDLGVIPPSTLIPAKDLTFIEDARNSYFEMTLQLIQPLYTWGKLKGSVDLAALGLEASRVEFIERERQLHRELHKAYFTGVFARDSAGLLEQILDILEEIEKDRRRAFELGSVNKLSVLQIETQISGVRRQLVQAREAYRSALEAVVLYTDLDPQDLDLSAVFRKDLPRFTEVELKEKAERNSPSLRKALLDQEQARANLNLVRGGATFRPDISFNLSFEVSGQTIPWSEDSWEDTWDLNLIVGVGSQGSLFDSGRSGHRIRQAEEALAASHDAIDLLRKQTHLQTRRAVEELQLRQAELQEAEAAVIQAEEEEKNSKIGFEQQLLTREHWGAARIALLQKRLELLAIEYSLELALSELESVVGFRWPGLESLPIN